MAGTPERLVSNDLAFRERGFCANEQPALTRTESSSAVGISGTEGQGDPQSVKQVGGNQGPERGTVTS